MSDDLKILGVDGIRRSYDEHYDTMMDVEQDPTGAWQAIQKQADRIEELEAKLDQAACFITDIEAGPSWGESLPSWVNNQMLKARTTLAELKGQDDE